MTFTAWVKCSPPNFSAIQSYLGLAKSLSSENFLRIRHCQPSAHSWVMFMLYFKGDIVHTVIQIYTHAGQNYYQGNLVIFVGSY